MVIYYLSYMNKPLGYCLALSYCAALLYYWLYKYVKNFVDYSI